ncbi:MAG: DNA polymerase III subunit delta' [Peptococcales bacterium]
MGFREIKGQETAIQILKNSIINNHVSHSYLFQGPEGVGKKTAALAFATTLNCLNLDTSIADACRYCLSCKKAQSNNHPDIHLIEPEKSSIKIDQIRNLRSQVFYKCYEGKQKIIILDDAHLLTIEASNSLLKVLEEPPERTVFILVTAEASKLPDTIISRCQQVVFQPLSVNTIKELLGKKHLGENAQINLTASLSGGSLSKTKELLDEGEFLKMRQEALEFSQRLSTHSFSDIILWCEKWDREKQKVKTIFEIIELWYRDLLVYTVSGREEILINQDYLNHIKNFPQSLTEIKYALLLINESIRNLEYNVNPRLILEVFFMKLKLT